MKKFAKVVTTVAAVAAIAAVGFAAGCSGDETSSGYTLSGETLVQQTTSSGALNQYYGGILDLAEDGSATFTYTLRDESVSADEATVVYTWSGGTWTENDDGTIDLVLNEAPDGGGEAHDDASGVDTAVTLDEYELMVTKNSSGKLEVEVSIDVNLITYSIHQYTEITLTQE